jgi:predicted ATPase
MWRPLFRHLGVAEPGDEVPSGPTDEELGRHRLFAAVVDALDTAGRSGPLLVVLEDLHWADPLSLVLLRLVAEALPGMPVCLLATVRDDPLEATTGASTA